MYILPKPRQLEEGSGCFELCSCTKIVIGTSCGPEAYLYASMLKDSIRDASGITAAVVRGTEAKGTIYLTQTKELEREAYRLTVKEDGIVAQGGGSAGILYAVQTLRQIVGQCGALIPVLAIYDYPDMPNRGFYHDVTRGRVPTLDYLKRLADRMSYYKLNELQLYVEHTYMFEGISEMWRDETPLTAEEILELDEYCALRQIELVPSLASFGHLCTLLSTKTYCELCEFPDSEKAEFSFPDRMRHHTVRVADDRVLPLIKRMIGEYMALFRTNKFNLCADETFDLGKGRSKVLADQIGVERMYTDYVKELCTFLVENGKIPMFWGDVITHFPEFSKELPKETICLTWGYAADQNDYSAAAMASAGAVQYVCPGVAGWNQWVNIIEGSYQNITRMCSYGRKYGAIGVLNTDWGDFGHINHPEFSVPGMIYGAAFSWNGEEIPYEDINRAISRIEYRDRSERFVSLLAALSGKTIFEWDRAVYWRDYQREGKSEVLRKEYFQRMDFSKAEKCRDILLDTRRALKECALSMDPDKRDIMQACEVTIRGILIWNRVGAAVSDKIYHAGTNETEYYAAAEELESWYMQYKELWRSVSREGDLKHIGEVVFYYADLLRGREICGMFEGVKYI